MKGMTVIDSTPICSVCTRDWDERLGYCEACAARQDDEESAARRNIPASAGLLEDNFS